MPSFVQLAAQLGFCFAFLRPFGMKVERGFCEKKCELLKFAKPILQLSKTLPNSNLRTSGGTLDCRLSNLS